MSEFRPRSFQVLPPVIKNLLIINGLVFLLQYILGKTSFPVDNLFALHYWGSSLFKPWQLITHMFMHSTESLAHIFSNMFALWMFGAMLENVWGPKKFLTFYFVCGLGAALLHLGVLSYQFHLLESAFRDYQTNANLDTYIQFIHSQDIDGISAFSSLRDHWETDPSSSYYMRESTSLIAQYIQIAEGEPTIGASGAVMGILFAFGYMFPNTLLYFYFLFPIKAKYFVALYALFELYSGIRNTAGDNVAHFAHIGGMLFAFILLKIWERRHPKRYY